MDRLRHLTSLPLQSKDGPRTLPPSPSAHRLVPIIPEPDLTSPTGIVRADGRRGNPPPAQWTPPESENGENRKCSQSVYGDDGRDKFPRPHRSGIRHPSTGG